MTTVVVHRAGLRSVSARQAAGAIEQAGTIEKAGIELEMGEERRSKRGGEYEQDDDFHFVRKSKRAKTVPEQVEEEAPAPRRRGRTAPREEMEEQVPRARRGVRQTQQEEVQPARRSARNEEQQEETESRTKAQQGPKGRAKRATRNEDEDGSAQPVRKTGRGRPRKKAVEDASPVAKSSKVTAASASAIASKFTSTSTPASTNQFTIEDQEEEVEQQDEMAEDELREVKKATRRSARKKDDEAKMNGRETSPTGEVEQPKRNGRGKAKAAPQQPESPAESPIRAPVESAKIALPMSDTPIINRNKEMRKKGGASNRRSSLGSRGRRASSLIDSGQVAIPHREVDPSEFYKHIAAEGLPEPRRMKQLLMWCGERALAAKPKHGNPNSSAILGARAIQDQLLKDFASNSQCSDWFSREDEVPKAPVILQPNPRNIELDEKKKVLEAKIKRLQEEKKSWLAIRKAPPEQTPLFTPEEVESIVLPEFDLLDLEEGKIRGYLADEAHSISAARGQVEERLKRVQSSLEFEVDQLVDSVHKLEQRVGAAGREADRVLGLSARRLREREEGERRRAGTRDMPIMEVLRGLSSILPEG